MTRSGSQRTAGGFDRGLGTGRPPHALQRDLAAQFARLEDLDVLDQLADQAGLLQRLDIVFLDGQALQFGKGHFAVVLQLLRLEAALGQATLQRHLAAFEADLVVAAPAGLLPVVAAAAGLAQARADAATNAAAVLLGAFGRLDGVELHVMPLVVAWPVLTAPGSGSRPC